MMTWVVKTHLLYIRRRYQKCFVVLEIGCAAIAVEAAADANKGIREILSVANAGETVGKAGSARVIVKTAKEIVKAAVSDAGLPARTSVN